MGEILEGLQFMHDIGVVHRDLKLENIMIEKHDDGKIVPKIIDFGLSIVLTPTEKTREICGTLAYCSPELVNKDFYNH